MGARIVKKITAPEFVEGDIVELPSRELVRYQGAGDPPYHEDRGWHLHPQDPDGGTGPAATWEGADRSLHHVGEMWTDLPPPHWHGGLVAPDGKALEEQLVRIGAGDDDSLSNKDVTLCAACYTRGPDGDGYTVKDGDKVKALIDCPGYCEICEFEVEESLDDKEAGPEASPAWRELTDALVAFNAVVDHDVDLERQEAGGPTWARVVAALAATGVLREGDKAKLQGLLPTTPVAEPEASPEPKCPKCGEEHDLYLRETYLASHPMGASDAHPFGDGDPEHRITRFRNALGEPVPSRHFDDGAADYLGLCGSCGHTDDPDAFGFGEIEWD